jgi:hypothetical protein
MNVALKIALLVWVLGYLFVSCGPILGGHLLVGTIALFGGILFFIPWLIGVAVLGVAIWLTNPPRR